MNYFSKNLFLRKTLACVIALAIIFSSASVLFIPKEAEASVPIHCTMFLDFNCIKESALDLIARTLAATLIRGLTNTIIGWIQNDGGANVGFVANFEQEFRRQVDLRGGEFLNQMTGINLCGDIGAFLQVSLRTSTSMQQQFACTLTDVVDNVENFFQDFSQGGWPAFIRISQQPQNNPYGAFIIAYDAKIRAEGAAAAALERNLLTNNGFKGVQKETKAKCEGDQTGTLRCQTEYLLKTPGNIVRDMLSESVLSGPRFGYVADEIDEAFSAIVSALIQKLIGSVSDGIFNPSLSNLSINKNSQSTLTITSPTTLPTGQMGAPYAQQLTATKGVPPYQWSIITGTLPPGLTLDTSGLISGTPTTAGTFTILVQVKDSVKDAVQDQIIIQIDASDGSSPTGP